MEISFFHLTCLMNLTISSELKFIMVKSIIFELFNKKLISIEDFGELIIRLVSIYEISAINQIGNE